MPRIIYAPSNGPACSMEDLVAQYIDWSPTIYNDVSQGFYMAPEQMQYCPTKAQIKNSASMSVTLYKQAVYKDSSIIQFKKGTTYKFNGEIGQFPKLYVLDMYPDFKPTKQYSSKELVKLCDVSAFYNHHEITLRLNNFSLIDGQFPKVSSNLVIDSDNVQVITDSAIYPYDMKEETYFSWSLPKIDYVANSEQYKQDKFTYNVIGYDNLAGPYTLGSTIDVIDVERDVTIDVYAEKKDLINVYISTDGRVRVINYLSDMIDLDSEESLEPNIIIDPPSTYATYKTDYPVEKYDRFKFLIQPDDAESLESYNYVFKKNGVSLQSSPDLNFTKNSSIYEEGLLYRDTETSAPNSYTLMITTKEKYRGNTIRIIINNEVADSLEIEVSEESSSSGFERISSKTTSSKMEFSYVIQKEGTTTLYIRVTGIPSLLKNYDLINSIYASNNRGDSTDEPSFGNGINSAVLVWTHGVGRNTIIYIKIKRTQLLNVTIKRLTEDISVHDNYNGSAVVFNGNVATISTTKAYPSAVNLTVKNLSKSSNVINYKWYVRSKVDTNGYWKIGYNETANFKKEKLLSGKSYTLELNGSIAYTEKIVSVIINNNDSSAHITVSDGEWSEFGDSYNTLSVYSSENGGKTVKYKMTNGYYFRVTIHVQEDYMFSSCSYTCVFRDKINSQMGSTVSGSVEFDESTNNFVIVIPNIPAECSYVIISTTYSNISTYSITVSSVANVNVYEYDYATGMFNVGSICTAGNNYIASVNTTPAKPNEVKLKFVSAAPDDYPTLTYTVYDTTPSRQVIVSETSMDITGSGTVWTSPSGMFETYGNGVYFQVMSLSSSGRTIYIYTTLTNVDLIIKDRYNNNNVIADFSSNGGSNYVSYITISGYYDRVYWDITWPAGYTGCDLELFGSDNATSPTSGTWVKVGSTKTEFDGTSLNFVWGHDLDGNSATEYTKYYIKFSNFMACSFEYIGISTESQSIDKISSYSKTNFIPTSGGGKSFNVLFRIPTTSGTLSIIPAIVNNGVFVNPDGTSESSPYTTFKSFCGNASNTYIDHTDGYTYIFYGFTENEELYGKYYINNTRYIYTNQTIKNAITFRNPKLTTETVDIDVYLDKICKLSWVHDCVVAAGSYKEFSRFDDSYLYFWAKLEKMKSNNCDTSSSKVVYEFSSGDLTLSPSSGFTLVEMTTDSVYQYGGSARWKFSHITFNENSYFTATLQHAERTIPLSLKAITPPQPVTYGTYFWYTASVTPNLATNWYWWTPVDPNTTLLGYSSSYGLGVHYNTPTSASILDGIYYKCGPSNIALARNGWDPTPVEMVNGQSYVLVFNTSQNGQWFSAGIRFVYIKPTTADRILVCNGHTVSEGTGYDGCHYEIIQG